ncbi:hypothetical protein H074_18413 [Amycolatopsis decaplanina DSM 44594]|uniref:Uncharacterized protein n=1 Tax=Amycolatopsis decaplanina DSM 44594 TaxID=1284240 RepID=M2YAF6_9PSEU|nr:hypothetical protein H074_18413 [Amycolatopsis decaplanina DSM 44594]
MTAVRFRVGFVLLTMGTCCSSVWSLPSGTLDLTTGALSLLNLLKRSHRMIAAAVRSAADGQTAWGRSRASAGRSRR